jgi:ribosomal protein S12 methylthiotransferase
MRTKSLHKKKVNIITLGCSKNVFDSEVLMGQLHANKFDVQHESKKNDAGIVIINTCGFIDSAKQESIDTILQYAEARKNGLIEKLIVTGCLSERYKTELENEISNVDAFFGTRELPRLLKTLNADYKHELIGERILTTPLHYAYFKIAEGCDRPCSFCAIPLMRGTHSSVPIEELVKNAQKLAANGVKELILIAQDLTYYGLDLYKKRKLADLLNYLSDIEGIEWIRLHYAYPSGFPIDVLDVMKQKSNICKYLDIPLQHASNNMLEAMRRGITKEKTINLISEIRNKIPEIAIRTTLITGYPGETEKDFEELKDFVKNMRFDRLGVFPYSHEENTFAYNFKDNVPEKIKLERANQIMQIQQEISLSLNQQKIGKTLKVLFDKKEGNYFVGRTEYDSPDVDNEVLIDAKNNYVRIGHFANVKITDATEFDLLAIPIN